MQDLSVAAKDARMHRGEPGGSDIGRVEIGVILGEDPDDISNARGTVEDGPMQAGHSRMIVLSHEAASLGGGKRGQELFDAS